MDGRAVTIVTTAVQWCLSRSISVQEDVTNTKGEVINRKAKTKKKKKEKNRVKKWIVCRRKTDHMNKEAH